MGCGCGGSKRQGGATAATRRGGGSAQSAPRPQGGYTWDGPARAKTEAPKTEADAPKPA